jgi:hypothetical protein
MMASLNQAKQRGKYRCKGSESCVICQPLPLNSKLTTASVLQEEAGQNRWNCHNNSGGTVLVLCVCWANRSYRKVAVSESSRRL